MAFLRETGNKKLPSKITAHKQNTKKNKEKVGVSACHNNCQISICPQAKINIIKSKNLCAHNKNKMQ